ncbi:MAG: PAS-domain containing protein, partial [Tateyamaria sp.]
MSKTEPAMKSRGPTPDAGWADAAFDALDMAAVLFGDDLTLRAANAAWRTRFAATASVGLDLVEVLGALTEAAPGVGIEGFSRKDLVGLVKSCVRDYELPRRGADPLLLTSTPTRDGGYLMTLRDPDRGRVVETRALELLKDSIEAVDMGMMVWDSGLIVRTANDNWARHVAPAVPGDSVHEVGLRILEQGVYQPRHAMTAEQTLTAIIMEAHRHKRHWEVRHDDGRHVRISTFPMQSGGVLAVAFDVTERRDVEAQARTLLADALDSLGDGVLLLDGHLNCLMHNK